MDTSITIKPLRTLYPPTPPRRIEGTSFAEDMNGRTPVERAQELPPSELRLGEQLKRRDREVRSHELAHKAVAGQYARGVPSYEYQIGPDGRRYAVGGEVSIDISKANDPRETLRKAEVIRRAAIAPANPSMQDQQIAMQASAMAVEARHELLLQEQRTKTAESQTVAGQQTTRQPNGQTAPTPTVRRAIVSIYRVLSSLEPPQTPFDQFT